MTPLRRCSPVCSISAPRSRSPHLLDAASIGPRPDVGRRDWGSPCSPEGSSGRSCSPRACPAPPAATASLLLNLELVATTLLAAFVFREHLGGRVIAGAVAVVTAGVVLVWTDTPDLRLGALFIVGACLCWGLDNCVTASLGEISPTHITLAKGAIAGSSNVVLGLAVGAEIPAAGVVAAALAVGAIGYGGIDHALGHRSPRPRRRPRPTRVLDRTVRRRPGYLARPRRPGTTRRSRGGADRRVRCVTSGRFAARARASTSANRARARARPR